MHKMKRKLTDKRELFIEISMLEYQEIRTELREVIARQNTVLFSSIAQFATLVGLGMTIISLNLVRNVTLWSSIIFGTLIPCITILLGVIWVDLAYRQSMMGSYIYSLESRVNMLLSSKNSETKLKNAFFWEHYNKKRKKVDFLSYLCSLLFYLALPASCFIMNLYVFGWTWRKIYYITAVFFSVCVIFMLVYGAEILKLAKSKQKMVAFH